MTIRALRLLTIAAALLALVLPVAGVAGLQQQVRDRGVIQSVDSSQIVLTALDGSVATFVVTPKTRVRLNGAPSSAAALTPGLVAEVTSDARNRAILIRAFGNQATTTDRGVVTAVTKFSLTIRTARENLSIRLDRGTKFRFKGAPALRFAVRPGALVAVKHAQDGPALVVNVLKRAGA